MNLPFSLPPSSLILIEGGIFLLHFPSPHGAWALSSLLPVGVRTFLHALRRSDPPIHSTRVEDNRNGEKDIRSSTPSPARLLSVQNYFS